MVTRSQAEQAQEKLGRSLDFPTWLRGIGLMHDSAGSYFLKVNVQAMTDEVRAALPAEIEGVPVKVDVVGVLHPRLV